MTGKARRENVPLYTAEKEREREKEMDWTLPSCRWVEGEEGVSNREDGGTEGQMDEWRGYLCCDFRGVLVFYLFGQRERAEC